MINEKRLIDANALSVRVMDASYWDNQDEDVIWNLVQDAPTVDAVEVVHGRWSTSKRVAFHEECSVCGGCVAWDYYGCPPKYNYCPNCGAKMDGERKTEDG